MTEGGRPQAVPGKATASGAEAKAADAPITYSIEPFGPAIREAYARLFADTPEKLAELDWRFGQAVHGPARFAIAEQGGAIVGMIALAATLLRGRFGRLAGVQAIDTIVSPVARGKFIFVRLGKIVHEAPAVDADLVWGFPNALAARGWFGKLGWSRFGTVPFLIKPLRTGYFLGRLWTPLRRVDVPLGFRARQDATIVTQMDDSWDRLWNRCSADFGVAVDRSAEWMRWRLDKPGADYRLATKVGPDGIEAAVITRLARKHGATICYVMEALAPAGHRHTLELLLRDEMKRAARNGADLALAWCPQHAPNRRNYARAGFFGLADRLRPIQIHFGARWLPPGEALGRALPGDQWYLSYLDSDTV